MNDDRLNVEIVADTSPAVTAFARLGRAINALGLAVDELTRTIVRTLDLDDSGLRYAIEHLDIPESDIRYVVGDTVVLWNHRRIPLARPEGEQPT